MKTMPGKFGLLFLIALAGYPAAPLAAQEFNSVPLDNGAYEIIEMGIMRGIILQPPSAKPWTLHTMKAKLWEMIENPAQILSEIEVETVYSALYSFERTYGFELKDGRYWADEGGYSFEAGLGWQSDFSIGVPGASLASINALKLYAGGDLGDSISWNVSARGEFLYIDRSGYGAPAAFFPFSFSKQWDAGVLSTGHPGTYRGWPDDFSFAYGIEAEVNGNFFDDYFRMRLGRLRRDWGQDANGRSLFLNAQARPFTAIEGVFMPLPWLNVSFLGGALENFRESDFQKDEGPIANGLAAFQVELGAKQLLYFDFGFAGAFPRNPDAAFYADIELRLPGTFIIWGGFFADRMISSSENSLSVNGKNCAFQGGVKTVIQWLSLAVFTFRYTNVQPFCYTGGYDGDILLPSAFLNGGESLGYYLPPNSDEFLVRLESFPIPIVKAYAQFQMIRSGVTYGGGAVGRHASSFLKDGVYQWDNMIKIGGSINFKDGGVPVLLYGEAGLVSYSFTINGDAGIGSEADHVPHSNSDYQPGNTFVFSIGFKVFP